MRQGGEKWGRHQCPYLFLSFRQGLPLLASQFRGIRKANILVITRLSSLQVEFEVRIDFSLGLAIIPNQSGVARLNLLTVSCGPLGQKLASFVRCGNLLWSMA